MDFSIRDERVFEIFEKFKAKRYKDLVKNISDVSERNTYSQRFKKLCDDLSDGVITPEKAKNVRDFLQDFYFNGSTVPTTLAYVRVLHDAALRTANHLSTAHLRPSKNKKQKTTETINQEIVDFRADWFQLSDKLKFWEKSPLDTREQIALIFEFVCLFIKHSELRIIYFLSVFINSLFPIKNLAVTHS